MIKEIKFQGSSFQSNEFLFEYLYADLLRFTIENKIDFDEVLCLQEDNIDEFTKIVRNSLSKLFLELYKEPSHKHRSKYPSRFRRINFNNRQYVVDYRKDLVGKIAYRLDVLLTWLENQPNSPSVP